MIKVKKSGILNSEISKVLSDLGHTDWIVIADCGLPIPSGVKKIDVSLKVGKPSFVDVLALIEEDMYIEELILAEKIKDNNRKVLEKLKRVMANQSPFYRYVPHEEFKGLTKKTKAVIRTGE